MFRIAFDFFYDVGPFCDTGTETKASSGRMCTVQKHFKEMKKQKVRQKRLHINISVKLYQVCLPLAPPLPPPLLLLPPRQTESSSSSYADLYDDPLPLHE